MAAYTYECDYTGLPDLLILPSLVRSGLLIQSRRKKSGCILQSDTIENKLVMFHG